MKHILILTFAAFFSTAALAASKNLLEISKRFQREALPNELICCSLVLINAQSFLLDTVRKPIDTATATVETPLLSYNDLMELKQTVSEFKETLYSKVVMDFLEKRFEQRAILYKKQKLDALKAAPKK